MSNTSAVKPNADEDIGRLRELLDQGLLNALTVDTSIFDEKGRRLNKGMFSQLTQFGKHPADLLFSDVVLMEMKRHLIERLKSVKARFSPDLGDAWEFLGMEKRQVEDLLTQLDQLPSLEEICEDQFRDFLDESSAKVICAEEHVPMGELVRTYFEGKPPFEEFNPKKSEFPDAIALKTLDTWATNNGRHLLVVSKDKDWVRFCGGSERLHCISDLATALELLQTPGDVVKSMLQRVFDELQSPRLPLHVTLSEFIEELDWYEYIRVDANSQFEFELDDIDVVDVSGVFFPKSPQEIKLTEQDEEEVTITLAVQAQIAFVANFSFRKWDSSDKEYISMGRGSFSNQATAKIDITLVLPIANGSFNEISMDADIETIDANLGNIEPDWMSSGGYEE